MLPVPGSTERQYLQTRFPHGLGLYNSVHNRKFKTRIKRVGKATKFLPATWYQMHHNKIFLPLVTPCVCSNPADVQPGLMLGLVLLFSLGGLAVGGTDCSCSYVGSCLLLTMLEIGTFRSCQDIYSVTTNQQDIWVLYCMERRFTRT